MKNVLFFLKAIYRGSSHSSPLVFFGAKIGLQTLVLFKFLKVQNVSVHDMQCICYLGDGTNQPNVWW